MMSKEQMQQRIAYRALALTVGIAALIGVTHPYGTGKEANQDWAIAPELPATSPVELNSGQQEQLDHIAKGILLNTTKYIDLKVPSKPGEGAVNGTDLSIASYPQEWWMSDGREKATTSWSVVLGHANTSGTKMKLKTDLGIQMPAAKLTLENPDLQFTEMTAENVYGFLGDSATRMVRIVSEYPNYEASCRIDEAELTCQQRTTGTHPEQLNMADPLYQVQSMLVKVVNEFGLPTGPN